MTKFMQPTFTLPAGSPKLTQAEWDRAFGPDKEYKPKKKKLKKKKG